MRFKNFQNFDNLIILFYSQFYEENWSGLWKNFIYYCSFKGVLHPMPQICHI